MSTRWICVRINNKENIRAARNECIDHYGKIPIGKPDFDKYKFSVGNTFYDLARATWLHR